MSQTNQQVAIIITIVLILVAIGVIVLLLAVYYNSTKKGLLKEKEVLKTSYEKAILETQLEVQEQTMQTIGADLHDNVGQLLSLTSLTLNSIVVDNPEKAQQKIDAVIDLTKQAIKEMRLLGKLLQGDQLIVLGLSEAIRHQINWLEKSGHFHINYLCEGNVPASGNSNKDLILFRILQEVLNNIIKHAQANQINLKLIYEESSLALMIHDNGIGFNPDGLLPGQKGMGLLNMHKRAAIVGGEVNVVSTPGEGTGVRIFIPYP
jgi:two-component system NarL family sensor kinase